MAFPLKAQMTIDTTQGVDSLVRHLLLGQGVAVGNIEYKGNAGSLAYFTCDNNSLGLDNGILLSTGRAADAAGSNTIPFVTTAYFTPSGQPTRGDRDLNRICHGASWDAAVIEFDFVPYNNKISFSYVFASDEYPEYVGSAYDDVFGFVVTGPKITRKNIAVVPGTSTPVSVNTVNATDNPDWFVDNDYFKKVVLAKNNPTLNPDDNTGYVNKDNSSYKIDKKKRKKLNPEILKTIQYDGLTKVMEAWTYVVPFQKYHIKIAIGDVGDNSYDSAVLLQGGTFHSEKDADQPKFKDYDDISARLNLDSIFGINTQNPKALSVAKMQQDSMEAEAEHFSITNINFPTDSYSIPDSSYHNLEELAAYLKNHTNFNCDLYGYTDNQGSKKYNQDLSEHRAKAVMAYLVTQGVPQAKMKIAGFNFLKPLGDNDSEAGRARNRRVEVILVEQ